MKVSNRWLLLILVLALPSFAQIAKKDAVVLKFPEDLATFEKYKAWQAKTQYIATLSGSVDAIAINGTADWRVKQFPDLSQFIVKEMNVSDKNKPSEIYLVDMTDTMKQIKLVVPRSLDLQAALSQVLYRGTPDQFVATDYFRELEQQLGRTIYIGRLAQIPFEKQRQLNKWSGYDSTSIGTAEFKGKTYFSTKLSTDVVYNTIQVNQAERAARQTQDVLKRLRELYKILGKLDGIDGIKFSATVYSRDFVDEQTSHHEQYEIYLPVELVEKFVSADITNQELVDGATVLMDGDRVKVNLASFT